MKSEIKKLVLFFLLSFSLAFSSTIFAQKNWENAQWIWQAEDGPVNSWMSFRKSFDLATLPTSNSVTIDIAAESKYWMWINDELVVREGGVKRGPNKTDSWYDEVEIKKYLKTGKNTISILVWHWGARPDHYYKSYNPSGKGGMVLLSKIGDLTIKSDNSWKTKIHPAYGNSTVPTHRFKPENNIMFDAQKDMVGWEKINYDDTTWDIPVEKGTPPQIPWGELHKRNFPQWRDSDLNNYVNNSALNLPKQGNGTVIKGQLPYNFQMYPYIKVDAVAGKIITISADNWDANYVVEYVTKEGVQEFEVPSWNNGHNVLYNVPTGVTILELKYRKTGYDAPVTGSFTCDDSFYNTLWTKATNTLEVCMRDTYMDCPDRERALWWGDVVLQMGASFYTLDRKADLLTEKCANDLIGWKSDTGALSSPIPFSVKNFEYGYQMLSTLGMDGFYRYYLNTGNAKFVSDMYPSLKTYLLKWTMATNGLPERKEVFNKWTDWGANEDVDVTEDALYYSSCKAAVEMAKLLNIPADVTLFQGRMNSIEANFDKTYWKTGIGYYSNTTNGKPDDRANAMAVVVGLAKSLNYATIKAVLDVTENATPYMEQYVERSLFMMGYPEASLARMKKLYAPMVSNFSTTLYEGWSTSSGTKNHAWNTPNMIMSQFVGGIEPIEVGYNKYQVMPQLGPLKTVNQKVPSQKGIIDLNIKKSATDIILNLISPLNTVAVVGIPKKNLTIKSVTVNGAAIYNNGAAINGVAGISFNKENNDYIIFNVLPGSWNFVANNDEIPRLNVIKNQLKDFVLYPNPSFTGVFYLDELESWKVYTISGTKVLEGEGQRIDLSHFAKGIYLLKTLQGTIKLIYK